MLPANPRQFLVLPRLEKYQSSYYSAEQLQRLFDAIRDEPLYPQVKIAAMYGLRHSELLDKYGLPHIRFHELCHSRASLLLNADFTLKDVQEWMGHADIKMTADIYGYLDTVRKQSMATKLFGSRFE